MTDWDEPHDVKGLALAMKRSRSYVEDMKTCGFRLVQGRGTLRMAFEWLTKHPNFSHGEAVKVRFARRAGPGRQTTTTNDSHELALRVPR